MNPPRTEFSQLSRVQLEAALRTLQESRQNEQQVDRLDETIEELHVHRIELEMQNRALAETQVQLQQSIQRYTALYDRLPVGYLTLTPLGRILETNLRATKMLRIERPFTFGVYLRSFVARDEAIPLSAHLHRCAESDEVHFLDTVLRFADGSSASVQLSSQRSISPEGAITIHVTLTDVSALKQTQQALDILNAEVDALSHAISHDLRAPLASIGAFSRVVLEEHVAGLGEEGRTMVQRIGSAASRMEETLKQLLEYSRLTRQPMTLTAVNLDEVVRELMVEHRSLIQYRKATINIAAPLPAVRASRVIISQVLRNLLTNALKYTLPDQAPCVHISASTHGGTVVLKVADEGIGIDEKFHAQIFKLFERLHAHTNYPGAGMGLAIVRRAIERMHGRVWLESAPGKGSSFFVELPLA